MNNFDYTVWFDQYETYLRFYSRHPGGWAKEYSIEWIPYWGA